MSLAHELRDRIRAYLADEISLVDVHYWLAEHVQVLADSGEPEGEALAARAWILLSEFNDGLRSEPNVRAELSACAHRRPITTHTETAPIAPRRRPKR